MFHEGQQLGDYSLVRPLGSGGFGQVWQATKENDYFAVKLPYSDETDWKQITQEIGLWTLCGNHPNIVPIVEAKKVKDQVLIVSEYVPGGSLEEFLGDDGSLSAKAAVEMVAGILNGLHHLHENGIVHRDLKPANILLDGRTPRLTDFGVSRFLGQEVSGSVAGTLPYMAPESFEGHRNIQTDLWSVGVILYRLTTGKLPFPHNSHSNMHDCVAAILAKEPEELPSSVPNMLRKVVEITLKKDTSLRYQTVSQLQKELETLFSDVPQMNTIKIETTFET